ncbi:hypothetical protein BEL04_07485 [Mucilaginibacter sp. PPCGB 2223]|nr:hypothetical protein BEL04_07485 [Mucilaginibacter sp. PPCGB 2223]
MAQEDINFTSLTIKEGLPSNIVHAIVKDRHGLMWFGTANGLSRFDGTNYYIYRHETEKPYSLPGNEILSLCADREGKIWIGSGANGLSYYDRAMDRIVPYTGDGSWPNIIHISPRAIIEDHLGNIWLGTYGDCRMIDPKTGHITQIIIPGIRKLDESFVVLSLLEGKDHRIWIGTNKGLYLFEPKAKTFTRFANIPGDPASLSDNLVKSIIQDQAGNIWIGTYNGLDKMLPGGHFQTYRHNRDPGKSISSDAVFALSEDKQGKIWIGTEEGVDIYDPGSATFRNLHPDPRNVFSLHNKSVRSIFIDKGDIYWVGTFGGGVAKYNKNTPLFNLKQSNPFDPFGLRSPMVTSFAEKGNGPIYIGTDGAGMGTAGAGIEIFDRVSGLCRPLKLVSKLHRQLLTIFSLYFDRKGFLWAGTYHDGVFRINTATGQYEQIICDGTASGLSHNDVTSIIEDNFGNFWIGTLGGGIDVYNPQTKKMERFNKRQTSGAFNNQLLPLNGFISCIVKSPTGEMWIGSVGDGVVMFDPKTKHMEHYTKDKNNIPYDIADNLFFDSSGTLWISTELGLGRFDRATARTALYTEKDGLANAAVKCVTEDKTGMLWISTEQGISSFDRQTRKFRNFNGDNGVQQGSFYSRAVLRTPDGDIYFGGHDGFNFFNPQSLPKQGTSGPVLLTDLKISNQSVAPSEDAPIQEQLTTAKEINLKYGMNFAISYVALNFTAPKQNQFAYRLVGFDKEWNYVRKGKTANYTNIDPGNYVFQVKASSDGEHWTSPPTEIKVFVAPPIWRTSYAYIIYLLLLGTILFLLRRRGIQKIRQEFATEQEKIRIAQERREAERLHELDLLKIKFLTDLSHEFRTPISLIVAPVENLLQKRLATESREDIEMINRNARRLLNMVNQLLDFRKMEEQELKLNLQAADVITFAKDAGNSFKDLAAKKKISFSIECKSDCWYAEFDHDKLERIIFNLLSNAFKFTPAEGEVTLQAEITGIDNENPCLTITVTDTGTGIPANELQKIFERFYQHQTNDVMNQGTGIGLSITKEFVELHGGHIRAENMERGSRFVVKIPMPGVAENITEDVLDILLPDLEPELDAINSGIVSGDAVANQKTTVLLVEDNDEFRSYLVGHLKQYYHIVEAANGKEGWQKTLSAHPQLIVSDINMPLMNGIDLSRKVKADKRTSHIPVILLTAMTGEEDQLKGLQSGASDYLSKPFNFQILNTKIGNLLDLNRTLKDTYSKQIQLTGKEVVAESTNLKLLNSIMKYIEDKLSDSDLSVEELSKHVGMSRGSLYYKLIELTGLTPIEYIRTVKLEKAAALLEISDYNVAQIAYMTGFGTPSYFSRMFKNKYGMVPSEYLNFKRGQSKLAIAVE